MTRTTTKTRAKKPPPPPPTRGELFAAAVLEEYELGHDERELLVEACRCLDLLDELHATIEADGRFIPGSRGQVVLHPAVGEARQHRVVLLRILGSLGLALAEGEGGAALPTPTQLRGRAGAAARWSRASAGEARRRAGAVD